ncbi:hypothetical protein K503DRAFT_55108 [Rhizopogon vinicolor AM-OR11-026]|uniref:Uncharacterized protein n=1 Tax=Rhizopogon vinicolor AM-OR11-026 TaxID=1314800 RepID=A0A1B7N4J5_9AGAM|nr:hypothetical protein K503DRAFT_55108 [Rhizopogon vinicolor AM-OR11-026]
MGHWLLPSFWHTFSKHIMGDGGEMSGDKRCDVAGPLDLSTVQARLVTSLCGSSLTSCTSASRRRRVTVNKPQDAMMTADNHPRHRKRRPESMEGAGCASACRAVSRVSIAVSRWSLA